VETLLETEAEHRGAQYFGLNTALTARWTKKDQSCDMQLHAPAAPAFSPTNYASLHRRPPPGLLFLKNFLEKLVEFVRNLIREQQHGAAGVNALHVRLNNAFDLSWGDRNPRCFPTLPEGQVQDLFGEHFLGEQRFIGTQDIQACPYSFDTLSCGKLDSCLCLGAHLAVSTHARAGDCVSRPVAAQVT
jgi:hypothetical protein